MDDENPRERDNPGWDPGAEAEAERAANERDAESRDAANRAIVASFLESLPDRTRAILEFLYGVADAEHHTLKETGERFGISKQRVAQIRDAALASARRAGPR